MSDLPPLQNPQFHAGDPFAAFRRLRTEMPISWHPTPGFWALARHEDVVAVSRDAATFCTSKGILLAGVIDVAADCESAEGATSFQRRRIGYSSRPPSMTRVCPVTNDDAALAK